MCKAIYEGKISLSDSINQYIDLPDQTYYPTFERLATHTSGYRNYYFDWQMVGNFLHGEENDYYNISTDELSRQIDKHILKDKDYKFCYSNFGISVIGTALENIYGDDYTTIMNQYISSELGLQHTKISEGVGDLEGYWHWEASDGYIPSGAIVSTITDMMNYAKLHMTEALPYLSLSHQEYKEVNASTKQYKQMGIRIDSVGLGWMIDKQNHFIWHNGGTSNYNSYLAIDKENQIAVVILSNLSPDDRIPATVMGVELMTDLQEYYR